MIDYDQIKTANEAIQTTTISRTDKKTGKVISKEYAEVSQRIKAFRMVYPMGFINTEMVSNENGVCLFRATVGTYDEKGELIILANGTAYEQESSNFINQTSYIENCETSAVGRALGMAGFGGIDTSVASAEEVQNAIENQEPTKEARKASPKQIEILAKTYTGKTLEKLLEHNEIARLEDLPMTKASELIGKLKGDKK